MFFGCCCLVIGLPFAENSVRVFRGRKPVEAFAVKPLADNIWPNHKYRGLGFSTSVWPLALGAQRLPPAPAPAPLPPPSVVPVCEGGGGGGGRGSHFSPHALLSWLRFSHTCLFVRTFKFYSLLPALSKDMHFWHFNCECQVFIVARPLPPGYSLLTGHTPFCSPASSFLPSHLLLFLHSHGVPVLPVLSFFSCIDFCELYLCRLRFRDSSKVLICNYIHSLLLRRVFL